MRERRERKEREMAIFEAENAFRALEAPEIVGDYFLENQLIEAGKLKQSMSRRELSPAYSKESPYVDIMAR